MGLSIVHTTFKSYLRDGVSKCISRENLSYKLSGILFVLLFALSSTYLAEVPLILRAGIGPLVIVLGILYSNTLYERQFSGSNNKEPSKNVPLFSIIFIVIIGLNSLHFLPADIVQIINQVDVFLLTMAMAAIGMETNLSKLKNIGLTPIYLSTTLFCGITAAAVGLVKLIYSF